jgi:transmembrane sensor
MEGNVQVIKEKGKIFYRGLSELPADAVLYNEIIEDKGRYTSVQLPDGSTAWINSGSSIRYPLVFSGKERKITMTGRAAFLVVHNEKQPFRVYTAGEVFEDKGTEFNIDAYETRAVRMTVREGMVQVKSLLVRPNEQVKINETGDVSLIKDIDTGPVFAWRNNEFDFTRATVEEIMQEAARWYDIEVKYQGRIDQRFSLTVSRDKPISALLRQYGAIRWYSFRDRRKESNGQTVAYTLTQ